MGKRFLRVLAWIAGLGLAASAGLLIAFYFVILRGLPDFDSIEDYHPAVVSTVTARDGRVIGEFSEERRRLVEIANLPPHVVQAFIAAEDGSFYEHEGLDYRSIVRAAWAVVRAGKYVQGASTITQQTVKSLLLSPDRKLERKLKEMVLARRLEQHFSKNEILTLYLNQIYFGSGAHGVGEAALTYFGKEVTELSVGEAALLAGLPARPSEYSPRVNRGAAERRRQYVLGRMLDMGFIDESQHQEAGANEPELGEVPGGEDREVALWFSEEVRRLLYERLSGATLLRDGLHIETTLDLDLQHAATRAVKSGLIALDRRQGWGGPLRREDIGNDDARKSAIAKVGTENGLSSEPNAEGAAESTDPDTLIGLVVSLDRRKERAKIALGPEHSAWVALEDVKWARERDPTVAAVAKTHINEVFKVGDVARFARKADSDEAIVLFQEPEAESALLALDVDGGEVLALVGGYDYTRSQFDRAVQARRQPGSAFKPLIYAAAIERGYTAVTTLYDRPVVYTDPKSGFEWRPENYGRRFLGPLPMREALARSVNNATIHLLRDVGVRPVLRFSRQLGIRSPLEDNLSLALGSSPVSVLELTRAYGVLASGGRLLPPTFIKRVLDRDGNVLLENLSLDDFAEDQVAASPTLSEITEDANGDVDDAFESVAPRDNDPHRVMDPVAAFLAADLVRGVVEHPRGTGRRARSLGRPVAGKTGTTNEQGDAWFIGFSRDLVVGVWVGFDERKVLGRGETGGRAALPIWIDFMAAAHEGRPARDFPVPAGVSFAQIDRATGKLAGNNSKDVYFQAFRQGSEPTEQSAGSASSASDRKVLRLDF